MAHGSRYKLAFKRRKEGKTNYKSRLKLITLEKCRMVVRITNYHVITQLVKVNPNGDETIISAHSKELEGFGWKGNNKNTSAAYLTGFLFGKKVLKKGITEVTLDIGLKSSIKGSKIFAVMKGAADAGVDIPYSDAILPDYEKINGVKIAEYAKNLNDTELKEKFSQYFVKGLSPVELPDHFEKIKSNIETGVS